jgi:hypothetical protein
MILQWDESFDFGSDTLTGVNDVDYKPPFPLTAKLNKLTMKVDRPKLSPEDVEKLETIVQVRSTHQSQDPSSLPTVQRIRKGTFGVFNNLHGENLKPGCAHRD